jgi:hypothetical protein
LEEELETPPYQEGYHQCLEGGDLLPTYKGEIDPDTYKQKINNICQGNQDGTYAKPFLFLVTLKK